MRSRYLAGVGRMPWLTWRSRAIASLYAELAEAAQAAAPGCVLAVVTPGLDGGPAGAEARRVDRAGLAPSQAWRSVGLDLQAWPSGPGALPGTPRVSLSTDALAHDLATSPDLDALVAARAQRGLLLTIDGDRPSQVGAAADRHETTETPESAASSASASARPVRSDRSALGRDAPARNTELATDPGDLADGLAAGRRSGRRRAAGTCDRGPGCALGLPGGKGRCRARGTAPPLCRRASRPARLAGGPLGAQDDPNPKPFGVAVRSMSDDAQTFLEIANDSPYPIRLAGLLDAAGSASVEDLGRGLRLSPVPEAGGRNLVLDLLPYGVAAIRVGAPRVQLSSVTPYPSEAVLTSMQSRFNELSAQLARLNHGLAAVPAEPANPGFEPDPRLSSIPSAARVQPADRQSRGAASRPPRQASPRPRGLAVGGEPGEP